MNNPQHPIIWISGSLPESTHNTSSGILDFIENLTFEILRNNGGIVHGCHPSITPSIINAATKYKNITNNHTTTKITFAVSAFFYDDYKKNLPEWRKVARVVETQKFSTTDEDHQAREKSLVILRNYIDTHTNAFIAVGGKLWEDDANRAGIPIEFNLAQTSGKPCFILGGFGGATQTSEISRVANHTPHQLRNGLSKDENLCLYKNNNPSDCAQKIINQLKNIPLQKPRNHLPTAFRILSIDGGGIKGAYSAAVLATLEDQLDCNIQEYFDLIVGTSTGGIIALALANGISARDTLNFYKKFGPSIFPQTRLISKFTSRLKNLLHPKHSTKPLREALTTIFSDKTLNDLKAHVLVPAFHTTSGTCIVFNNRSANAQSKHKNLFITDVAIATSAAPTYFHPAKIIKNNITSEYIDGGIWANTPSLVGVIEAIKTTTAPLREIKVLRIGTTEEPTSFQGFRSLLNWAPNIVSVILRAQQDSAVLLTKKLLEEGNFLSINHTAKAGQFSLDDTTEIETLATLGESSVTDEILQKVRLHFVNNIKATAHQKDKSHE